ncbi:hypothetical protein E2C01_011907 [Portunus trituberculatus]|uniref:Uncharacterized protein n=1 Tax=Portunus trituberculatus TaxID=210409 RepID=A0A5B7DCL1_PORTR|nr:hypothetical protein [Portunus trituberculatus]
MGSHSFYKNTENTPSRTHQQTKKLQGGERQRAGGGALKRGQRGERRVRDGGDAELAGVNGSLETKGVVREVGWEGNEGEQEEAGGMRECGKEEIGTGPRGEGVRAGSGMTACYDIPLISRDERMRKP